MFDSANKSIFNERNEYAIYMQVLCKRKWLSSVLNLKLHFEDIFLPELRSLLVRLLFVT